MTGKITDSPEHFDNAFPHPAVAAVIVLALCGCSDAPLCRYWTDEPIGRSISDPSALPMLPYNPYWVGTSAAMTGSPQDACAGEPGHPGAAVD